MPLAVNKLGRELTETREALGLARARLAEATAAELLAAATGTLPGGGRAVIADFPAADAEWIRAVAKKLAHQPGLVAFLAAPTGSGTRVIVARGPESAFDCGACLKRIAAAAGGRGGGRPEQAEGNLPAGIDWPAAVAASLTTV